MSHVIRVLRHTAAAVVTLILVAPSASAQVSTNRPQPIAGARPVTLEWIKVHAPSIAGNLEGETADRDVLVVLPPGYAANPRKRYPVVYALHGYFIGADQWSKEIHMPLTAEGAFAKGAREMIVVLPDSKTIHNGSFYSSSVTTGDFETFISRDLVRTIESRYRAIPDRRSRGLAGHSMGGYGVARIGMRHADVFGAIYMMSPCCLSARAAPNLAPEAAAALAAVRTPADVARLPTPVRSQLAAAAAWSPNPNRPPLYLDLPSSEGAVAADVVARWAANAPLAFVDQYIPALRSFKAIAIDVGDQDGLRVDAGRLHAVLDTYKIANSFEIYPGTHTSQIAFRFQDQVLPFFSQHLDFASGR
jgi:enterochelin esterase-like enzyme